MSDEGHDSMTTPEAASTENLPSSPLAMTARERNQRIALIVLLLLLLASLATVSYFWFRDRALPIPAVAPATKSAIAPPQYLYSITGKGANQLRKPLGVDVAPDGRVFVVDFGARLVRVYSTTGRYLYSFNKIGAGKLKAPVHLLVDRNQVYVSDRRLRTIEVFSLDGKYLRTFRIKGEPKFRWSPLALSVDAAGRLRVTDVGLSNTHRVIYFSREGSRTVTVGKTAQVTRASESPGGFYFPDGIAVASNGNVYVADGDNRRIQVFGKYGDFVQLINSQGVPRGLAIDDKNRLFAVDALAHQVDIYDSEGEKLVTFGENGFGPGQFAFPNDVALDTQGHIFVSDRENNQVQVWGWPRFVVPASIIPTKPTQWGWCFTPLLLLPLLWWLRRKRTYVLTPQFAQFMASVGRLELLDARRTRYVAYEGDRPMFEAIAFGDGTVADRVDFVEYSASDAQAIRDRIDCDEHEAIYLALSERAYGLLTIDDQTRGHAGLLRIRAESLPDLINDLGAEPLAISTQDS